MSLASIPIISGKVDKSELLDIVSRVELPEKDQIHFGSEVKSLLPGLDASLAAELISGGAATLVALINGLFLLWSQREKHARGTATREKGTVIVTLRKRKIRISTREHLVRLEELEGDELLEIRLD